MYHVLAFASHAERSTRFGTLGFQFRSMHAGPGAGAKRKSARRRRMAWRGGAPTRWARPTARCIDAQACRTPERHTPPNLSVVLSVSIRDLVDLSRPSPTRRRCPKGFNSQSKRLGFRGGHKIISCRIPVRDVCVSSSSPTPGCRAGTVWRACLQAYYRDSPTRSKFGSSCLTMRRGILLPHGQTFLVLSWS